MVESLHPWIALLIPALPLLAAVWIAVGYLFGWNRGEAGERETAWVALVAISLSLLLLLVLDGLALSGKTPGQIIVGDWLTIGSIQIHLSFLFDRLALVMATLVAFISLLVTRFSVNYLHREAGFQRFFLVLSLFNAAMLLIVTAGSAVFTFFGWELAGVSSYLLIGYAWNRNTATTNATRAFVTNRIGDAGFVLALVFTLIWLGSVEWSEIPTVVNDKAIPTLEIGLIIGGFLLAALAKSAQLPFSSWVTRALEGPTPSSTIFYGALMIHAGVYLMLRMEPLLTLVPALMTILLIIGLLTSLYAWLTGLAQSDIKTSLMFATLTQVGLMLIWIGLGWFDLALLHLVVHAIWRSYQFLSSPSYMQQVQQPAKPAPAWLRKHPRLYTAAMQRFWLDDLSDWLLVKPTRALAHEAQLFDEQVVDRLIGIPSHANMLSTLSRLEASKQGLFTVANEVGKGRGLFGFIFEWLAEAMQWLEDRLVLPSDGGALMKLVNYLGRHLEKIDHLLAQPRYLLLIIMATIMVVL